MKQPKQLHPLSMGLEKSISVENLEGQKYLEDLRFEEFKYKHNPTWLYRDIQKIGFSRDEADVIIGEFTRFYLNVLNAYRNIRGGKQHERK